MELWRYWGQSLVSVRIYVEGGGDSKQLKIDCRRGFSKFFEKAGLAGRMPRIHACGPRNKAFDKFRTKLAESQAEKSSVLLLVDSEEPVSHGSDPWSHLKKRDGWKRPDNAGSDNVHLMVQCMESWFLADVDSLEKFFGDGFRRATLPKNPKIEKVTTDAIDSSLKSATRQCKSGPYSKGSHSFRVLAVICPVKVANASPHAKRLMDTVSALAARK